MMNKIDTNLELPVEIKSVNKKDLIKDLIFKKKIVEVESKNLKSSYMIFAFQKIKQKYGIDYDTIIILNYLNELNLFSMRLKVERRTVVLSDYRFD